MLGRKINHGSHLPPDQFIEFIIFGYLGRGLFLTDFRPKIHPQLDGRAMGLRKGFGAPDGADADVNFGEIVEADFYALYPSC